MENLSLELKLRFGTHNGCALEIENISTEVASRVSIDIDIFNGEQIYSETIDYGFMQATGSSPVNFSHLVVNAICEFFGITEAYDMYGIKGFQIPDISVIDLINECKMELKMRLSWISSVNNQISFIKKYSNIVSIKISKESQDTVFSGKYYQIIGFEIGR